MRRAETLATDRLAEVAAERDAEDVTRQNAEAISKLIIDIFVSSDPSRDGRTITVAETFDKAAQKLESDLGTQPRRRTDLQTTLGDTYAASDFTGRPSRGKKNCGSTHSNGYR